MQDEALMIIEELAAIEGMMNKSTQDNEEKLMTLIV